MRGKEIEDDVKVLGLSLAGRSYHLLRWIKRVVVVVVEEGTWRRLIFDVKFEVLLTSKWMSKLPGHSQIQQLGF